MVTLLRKVFVAKQSSQKIANLSTLLCFQCAASSVVNVPVNQFWSHPIDKDGNFELKDIPFVIDLFGGGKANTMGDLNGQFEKGGTKASGEWALGVNDGTICSDTWTSTR